MRHAMSLKFSNQPQLKFNADGSRYNFQGRFPQGAQPIASAPQETSQPLAVYEANGKGHWALHHSGAWRKISPFRDGCTGAVNWRMDGTTISNPVAWNYPRRGK